MPAICSRTTSLNTEAWLSVRAMIWILSGSRSEILSRRALMGAGSTLVGIRPMSRNAPTALSRYCIGVRTTTSFMMFLLCLRSSQGRDGPHPVRLTASYLAAHPHMVKKIQRWKNGGDARGDRCLLQGGDGALAQGHRLQRHQAGP